MFFKKEEKKKHGIIIGAVVGMLATLGALSVTNKGKEMICEMKKRVTRLFKKSPSDNSCNMMNCE